MSFEYVEKPSAHFLCAICQDVYTDPVISRECNHSFCAACIARSLRLEAIMFCCPLCRTRLSATDLHPNLILKSITDDLAVLCPNRFLGCPASMTRDAVAAHLKSVCEFNLASCIHVSRGCAFEGPQASVTRHINQDCVYQAILPFIITTEEKIAGLEATIQNQKSTLTKLQKQLILHQSSISALNPASAVYPEDPTPDDPPPPAAATFPHTPTMECYRTISDNSTGVTALAFQSDSSLLISGAYDGSIKVFHAETGRLLVNIDQAHEFSVWAVAWGNSGGRFFSASSDGAIKMWELEKTRSSSTPTASISNSSWSCRLVSLVSANQYKVYSLQVVGDRLWSASSDGSVSVWKTGDNLELVETVQGHDAGINSLVVMEHDDSKIMSASHDKTVKIWDINTCTPICTIGDIGSEALDVTNSSSLLFTSTYDASILAFDINSPPHPTRVRTLRGHNWEVWQVKHRDGVLFSGSHDHTIKRWDLRGGGFENDLTLKGHKGYVHSFRFGNGCLISAGADKTIKMWR